MDAADHTIHYGYIYDGDELIDEVLVSVFFAPRSFTAENTVEISCHGGYYVTKKILSESYEVICAESGKEAIELYEKEKPDMIISSGAAVAVPFFYVGKIIGAKLIYIEVFDRVKKPTITGKMVYPIADKFVVQWEEQKKIYPKAINLGSIF